MKMAKFTSEQTGEEKDHSAGRTLHGHPQHGGAGHAAMLRVKGPTGPGERSNHQDGGAARVHAARASQMGWPDEEYHSRKAQEKPEHHFGYRPVATGTEPVHNHQPEGHGRDQKSRNAGRHGLFCPTDAAVS